MNQLSDWNELINKKVSTCEKIYIGRIIAIDGHSVTIRSDKRKSMLFLHIGLESAMKKKQ
jgi:hypothetical protein